MRRVHAVLWAVVFGVAACAGGPPPPDWQMSARSGLDAAARAWLEGRDAVEAIEFRRARAAIARTGRADLMARAELHRCAVRVAALRFEPCAGFEPLASDAAPEEQTYARYLLGRATPADAPALAEPHRRALAAGDAAAALRAIDDPLTRLVAAGAALRRSPAQADALADAAIDTASAQGWPRPLLAWLLLRQRSAQAAGQADLAERLQRRIDLIAPPQPSPRSP